VARFALLFAATISLAACTAGASPIATGSPSGYTRHWVDVPARQAFDELFFHFGKEPTYARDLPELGRVSARVRQADFHTSVRTLVLAARKMVPDLTVYHEGADRFTVARRYSHQSEVPGLGVRVSLHAVDIPFKAALGQMLRGTNIRVPALGQEQPGPFAIFDPEFAELPVTASFRNVSPVSGFFLVMGAAGHDLTMTMGQNSFVIYRRTQTVADQGGGDGPRRLSFRGTRLWDAAMSVLPGRSRLGIERDVPDLRITMNASALNEESAMRMIVAAASLQAPGLTFARVGDRYVLQLDRSE
jgi:hypothetical protein